MIVPARVIVACLLHAINEEMHLFGFICWSSHCHPLGSIPSATMRTGNPWVNLMPDAGLLICVNA
jgi:hypothetical protein